MTTNIEFNDPVFLNKRSYANDDFVVSDQLFVKGAAAIEGLHVKNNMKVEGGFAVLGNTKLLGTPQAPNANPTQEQHLVTLKNVNDSAAASNNTVITYFKSITDAINKYVEEINNGVPKEDAIDEAKIIIVNSSLNQTLEVLAIDQVVALINLSV